jgi:hypothetical protein
MYRLVFGDDEVTMRCVNLALSIVVSMGFAALATRIAVDPSLRYPTLEKGFKRANTKEKWLLFQLPIAVGANYSLPFSLFLLIFFLRSLFPCPPACLLPSLLYLFFNCATARAVHGRCAVVPIIKKFIISFFLFWRRKWRTLVNKSLLSTLLLSNASSLPFDFVSL